MTHVTLFSLWVLRASRHAVVVLKSGNVVYGLHRLVLAKVHAWTRTIDAVDFLMLHVSLAFEHGKNVFMAL